MLVIVNFKTYPSGTGKNSEAIAKLLGERKATAAVQATDIATCAKHCRTFAQHIDDCEPGRNTGFITAEAVWAAGAVGTLINHAEHKIPMEKIAKAVLRAKQNNLETVVCAASTEEAIEIAKACTPDYIAVEPPELIGGNVSVSKAKPEIITNTINAVHQIKKIPIICGAGVSGKEDVQVAKKLGAAGILVANFVMGASDKKKAIAELTEF